MEGAESVTIALHGSMTVGVSLGSKPEVAARNWTTALPSRTDVLRPPWHGVVAVNACRLLMIR
jgi:hypothetical protein